MAAAFCDSSAANTSISFQLGYCRSLATPAECCSIDTSERRTDSRRLALILPKVDLVDIARSFKGAVRKMTEKWRQPFSGRACYPSRAFATRCKQLDFNTSPHPGPHQKEPSQG